MSYVFVILSVVGIFYSQINVVCVMVKGDSLEVVLTLIIFGVRCKNRKNDTLKYNTLK